MELNYSVEAHKLRFKKTIKTSRNAFKEKLHWIVKVWDKNKPSIVGIGEAAPIELLSPDYREDLDLIIKKQLYQLVEGVNFNDLDLHKLPSVKFALESALLDLNNGGHQIYFDSGYLTGKPIAINGLVWMGGLESMMEEAIEKANSGYKCIKFKVGSHDFDAECRFIEQFRKTPLGKTTEIRLDANGAFLADEALEKLKELNRFHIHSIEQPIKQGQWDNMAKLCMDSKIAIALDEELIGVRVNIDGNKLLKHIKPQYIILKPTLLGGFKASDEWITLANKQKLGWWATSALESNYGLNAIAQWVGKYDPLISQGLGTGMLYENNFKSSSEIRDGKLFYLPLKV